MNPASGAQRELDCRARLAAQTVFDRPLALEAGAGTGKTATLVARIVAWCLGPGWEFEAERGGTDDEIATRVLDGIVAITFTDAAAAEMAGRVAEALAALESWDGETRPSSECPGLDEVVAGGPDRPLRGLFREALPHGLEAVRTRSRALLTQIEGLRTSTIHAFAATVLSRFPIEAELHPAFTVDASGAALEELVEAAVEEILTEAYGGGACEADALALARRGLGPAEITGAAMELARAAVPLEALEDDPFTEAAVAPLLGELAAHLLPCVPDAEVFSASRHSIIAASGRLLVELGERLVGLGEAPALELALDLAEILRAGLSAQVRSKLRNSWARGSFGQSPPEALSVEEMAGHLAAALPLLDFLVRYDSPTFNALRRILLEVLGRVETEKRRRGVVGFRDLLDRARALLERSQGVRRTLRAEIHQLLVDEMQDTDPDQAEIVRLLALGDPVAERPCLFLVGDPKQSIYGWRSADLAVYEALVGAIVDAGGECHDLVINFRSVPRVLEEVARLVGPVMQREEGIQPAFIPLVPCTRLAGEEGHVDSLRRPVEHWIASAPGQDGGAPGPKEKTPAAVAARLEARAVARDIASLRHAGAKLSEMGILMRSRGWLETLLAALREHGIPYVVGRDRSFFRTREVVEAMALLRVVLDRHDPLALAVVLRSPLIGVPDAALAPLWRAGLPGLVSRMDPGRGNPAVELEAAVSAAATGVQALGLRVEGLAELAGWPEALCGFLDVVGALRESFAADPPDRFLEKLRQHSLLEPLAAGRFPGAYRLANIDRFLRSLEELLLGGATAGTILGWLRRMGREQPDEEAGRPREEVGEAVRVLTIHGAKGLEFEHVWLLQTHAPQGAGAGPGTAAARLHGHWELCLAGLPTPGFIELEERRRRVEEAERVRLLYVALTRAKRRLVTSGCWNPNGGRGGSFLELLRQRRGLRGGSPGAWPGSLQEIWGSVGASARVEGDDAFWVLPGHPAWDTEMPPAPRTTPPAASATGDRIREDARRLDALRAAAAARQARPWLGGMSHEAHRELAQLVAAAVEGAETPEEEMARRPAGAPRDLAAAVGTAVHRVLERFEPGAPDPGAELERRRREAAAWLKTVLPAGKLPEARARLAALLETFHTGPLWNRWLALGKGDHILARELPVLLPPHEAPEAPVGALTGVIDLLYRDPDTGAPVIADYKTDDPGHLDDRAQAYRSQLALYARAIEQALGLETPPRTELWFLAAGEVVRLA